MATHTHQSHPGITQLRLHVTTAYGAFGSLRRAYTEVVVLEIAPSVAEVLESAEQDPCGSYFVFSRDERGSEVVRHGDVTLAHGRELVALLGRDRSSVADLGVRNRIHTAEGDLLYRIDVDADGRRSSIAVSLTGGYEGPGAVLVARLARQLCAVTGTQLHDLHKEHLPADAAGFTHADGQTLRDVMFARRPLAVDTAVAILSRIASSLAREHRGGRIRRRLTPDDIIVGEDGAAVLLPGKPDAGGPGDSDDEDFARPEGPWYCSPEMLSSDTRLDGRSDQFVLGVIGFEMLAGRPPHDGDSVAQVYTGIVLEPPPDVRQWRAEVPEHLAGVLARMLEKDPAARYPDLDAVAEALARA